MSIKLVAKIEQEFNEETQHWEAEVTPTLVQTFEGYYTCPEHGTLHKYDLTERQTDDTSGRCPHCNAVVDHKEETQIGLNTTLYEGRSLCEVNSAIETNLLILQRQCEEEGENLRQAEEDRKNNTVQITRASEEEADAEPEPEAG
jgi:hypothetical protein